MSWPAAIGFRVASDFILFQPETDLIQPHGLVAADLVVAADHSGAAVGRWNGWGRIWTVLISEVEALGAGSRWLKFQAGGGGS